MENARPLAIVVSGNASVEALAGALAADGFLLRTEDDLDAAVAVARNEGPRVVVVAAETFAAAHRARAGRSLPLVVAVVDAEELAAHEAELLAGGADEVLRWPQPVDALSARLRGLRGRGHQLRELERLRAQRQLLDEGAAGFDHGEEFREALHDALMGIVEQTEALRALLVVARDPEDTCYLLGTSDDPTAMGLAVPEGAFPELRPLYESRQQIVLDDVAVGPRVAIYDASAAQELTALLLQPLLFEGIVFGALELHFPPGTRVAGTTLSLVRAVSALLAPRVRHSEAYRSLREQTQRRGISSVALQRRRAVLQKYKEFFEHAADGIVVLDQQNDILHLNPMGEQVTGYADHGQVGRSFFEMVAERDRDMLRQHLEAALAQDGGSIFDLRLITTSGDPIVVSVSTSVGLATDEMVVLSFRDVTEARALSEELRATKDFLERLIDSTVDAIVAADIEGRVILFNEGAERIFGYSEEDVIGRRTLAHLYPAGVADWLMQQLRGPSDGGVGRLEMVRKEVVDAAGDLVPVRLSASIIYEDGVEVGTVSIISDLRERLHMERRLVQTQERLVDAEKQALIAELAGTTAHELNQPLTSVMGYAELLMRRIPEDDSNYRAADKIVQECQRLADIVRKIGKITRYETQTYVGGTQILDLDKSSEEL